MGEGIGGKSESLRYRLQQAIKGPAVVRLEDNMLEWEIEYNATIGAVFIGAEEAHPFKERNFDFPVTGCLEDFMSLADSTAEQVLRFVQRRGVLGIAPTVEEVLPEVKDKHENYYWKAYKEPIEVYTELARVASNICRVMTKLRDGSKVSEDDLRGCYWSSVTSGMVADKFAVAVLTAEGVYKELLRAMSMWQRQASYRLGVSAEEDEAQEARFARLADFRVEFGLWSDGDDWDTATTKNDPYATDKEHFFWHMTAWGKVLSNEQRPSQLFNVLTFQLLQAIILPENTYFCDYCGKPYQHDPNKKGHKPRPDRKNFHSPECRDQYRTEYDRERYRQEAAKRRSKANQADG